MSATRGLKLMALQKNSIYLWRTYRSLHLSRRIRFPLLIMKPACALCHRRRINGRKYWRYTRRLICRIIQLLCPRAPAPMRARRCHFYFVVRASERGAAEQVSALFARPITRLRERDFYIRLSNIINHTTSRAIHTARAVLRAGPLRPLAARSCRRVTKETFQSSREYVPPHRTPRAPLPRYIEPLCIMH